MPRPPPGSYTNRHHIIISVAVLSARFPPQSVELARNGTSFLEQRVFMMMKIDVSPASLYVCGFLEQALLPDVASLF
jgi:hypothetical protein